jgi:hypothetical protein
MGTVACNVGHSPFEPATASLSLGPPHAGFRLVIPLGEHLDAEVGGIWLAQCRPATSVKVSKLCLGAVRSQRCRRPSSSWTNWSNGPAHWPREAFARLRHLSCVPPRRRVCKLRPTPGVQVRPAGFYGTPRTKAEHRAGSEPRAGINESQIDPASGGTVRSDQRRR